MTPIRERDDFKALYATVLEHPAEDVPRLVVADYLEENGEGRYAEFIRIQIELATAATGGHGRIGSHERDRGAVDGAHNWPECSGCVALKTLERREGYLWAKLVGTWDWGVDEPYGKGFVVQPSFHDFSRDDRAFRLNRGFIDEVRCPLDWWAGPICGECDGSGEVFDGYDRHYDCRACGGQSVTKNGTGRDTSKANGPKVVLEHPITKVVLTDNDGWVDEYGLTGEYRRIYRFRAMGVERFLVREEVVAFVPDVVASHETRAGAGLAIGNSLLAWARKESLK